MRFNARGNTGQSEAGRSDVRFPGNTYRYPGLPPGPIASPGRAALEAAMNPAAVDYLYFVCRNDGSHAFARTLDEHNRNVQKYQVQYFCDQPGRWGRREVAGLGKASRDNSRFRPGLPANPPFLPYFSPDFSFSRRTSK